MLRRYLFVLPLLLLILCGLPGSAMALNVTGQVRNEAGVGLANVDVDFIDLCTGDNLFLSGDKTAADGSFNVVVPAGNYDVHFTPPSGSVVVAVDRQDLTVSAAVHLGIVTMPAGTLVSGTVRTPALAAAAGVDLKFVDRVTQHRVYLSKDVTNASGQYSVRVLPGSYDIDFRPTLASGFGDTERLGLVVGTAPVTGLVDNLRTGFAISGTVRDRNNNRIKNVDIDVFDACTGLRVPTAHDNTDANGNYTVVVPAGTYTFNYDPPRCRNLAALRTIGQLVDRARNIGTEQLDAAVMVSGFVVSHDGAAVAEAKVKFYDVTKAGAPRQAASDDRTDATGAFRVLVPVGEYDLNIEPPAGLPERVGHVNHIIVNANYAVGTIALEAGVTVSGHLTTLANVPVQNVNINAVDHATRVAQRLSQDATDANGDFAVVLAPGSYDLQYSPPGCTGLAPMSQDSVVVSASVTLPTLPLPVGVAVTGLVQMAGAVPVANVDLDFYRAGDGTKVYTPNDQTAADGSYQLMVVPGDYRVTFIPSALARLRPAEILSVPLSSSITLPTQVLASGWFLAGLIRDSLTLAPVSDVVVDLMVPGSGTPIWTPHHLSDVLGGYQVVAEAGTWDVRFTPAAGSGLAPVLRRGVVIQADTPLSDVLLSQPVLAAPAPTLGVTLAAYPNPMRSQLTAEFAPPSGEAELAVWDLSGRRVATLWRGNGAGAQRVRWAGRTEGGGHVAAGLYYLRLTSSTGRSLSRRVVVIP